MMIPRENASAGSNFLTMPLIAVLAVISLAGSLLLAGCQSVSGFSTTSLVRIIDASYNAPAVNVSVEGQLLASNVGQGNITTYGKFAPSASATVKITTSSTGKALASTSGSLTANQSQSVLITDIEAGYQVSVLQDQSVAATTGHSDFRFINQAPSTGAVDIYFLPGTSATVYATAKPIIVGLAANAISDYVAIPSSSLYMVIAPAGTKLTITATTIYTSGVFALVGGEVRTVLILDPQLSTRPVQVYTADDVN
ncbi:DUF4397 domain-containing protein [Acidicapsa ligni]|uniref:DUF4397 domain-containing protein n=1 Tax=Acidicapsa ligni TaxID=542300 RepID=UPI0021E03394|nr:DUF4397 domain-containing protein [Acidicapsa ligni]